MALIKIKLLTQMMGSITAGRGDVIEVSEREAAGHVAAGNAEYVNNPDPDPLKHAKVELVENKKRIGKTPVHTRV